MIAERLVSRAPQVSQNIINSINNIEEKNQSDFRFEYESNASDKALFDDVVYYLGEYRFRLHKTPYELKYSEGKLKDRHTGNTMQDVTKRELNNKIAAGNNYSRELGENKGIISLDRQLSLAKEGDAIVWASPPGPKEEGYGDYGLFFIGHIKADNVSEKTIQMTALRVKHPTIEQFNQAMHLLTGEKTGYKTPEEFLANPKVLSEHLEEGYVDEILGMSFSFKPNPQEQAKFRLIIQKMSPLISDFIQSAKNPWKTKAEKIKELYSLENYALKLKKDYEQLLTSRENVVIDFKPIPRLPDIVGEYGYKPPQAAGSCPAINNKKNKNSLTGSNIFSKGLFLDNLLGNQERFNCPKCGYQADGPVGDTCPGCKLTKQEYAQETGIICD